MKAIAILCFSLTGLETGRRLEKGLKEAGVACTLDWKSRYLPDSIKESAKEWAGRQFTRADGLVFVGACGIAVRSIAPYVVSKKTDPAVVVADECGKFVISLLSGHLGGANELAVHLARLLGAVPVVTTATDLHHRFAVDVFAKQNHCAIFHMKAAREVSAALLAGEKVGFYSEFPWEGELPDGLVLAERAGSACQAGVAVTIHKSCMPFAETTQLVPEVLTLGMGCRRGKEAAAIQKAAQEACRELDLYPQAFEKLASIDLKKEEPGLLALAGQWGLAFETYSGEQLMAASGTFTPSAFVRQTTGADNVCERSAVLASGQGRLIQRKKGAEGVTTAVAQKEWRIHFE